MVSKIWFTLFKVTFQSVVVQGLYISLAEAATPCFCCYLHYFSGFLCV